MGGGGGGVVLESLCPDFVQTIYSELLGLVVHMHRGVIFVLFFVLFLLLFTILKVEVRMRTYRKSKIGLLSLRSRSQHIHAAFELMVTKPSLMVLFGDCH